jgi:CheY-like chemotaxis protein
MVKPKLVIKDISDPGSAGNTIEALQAAYAAPILALSARFRRGLGTSSEPARRLHVAKVLPKPFTRQQLLRAVRETLKHE